MKAEKLLPLLTVFVIYSTMVIGSYVSTIGAGLACPDWPLCPFPTSWEIFIEYTHRGFAMLSFLLAIVTTYILSKRGNKQAKITATLGFVFLVIQVFMVGAIVIFSALHPVLVATHMGVALLVFALYTVAAAYSVRG